MIKKKQTKKTKNSKTLVAEKQARQYRVKKAASRQAKQVKSPLINTESPKRKKKVPNSLFLSKTAQKNLTKKELVAYTKKWYKYLKKQGFNDIEFYQSNGEFNDKIKKPLWERPQNKITDEQRFDHIQANAEQQQDYRRWSYCGMFDSLEDKIIWYSHFNCGLGYNQIYDLIKKLVKLNPVLRPCFKVYSGKKEISLSISKSKKTMSKFFWILDGFEDEEVEGYNE